MDRQRIKTSLGIPPADDNVCINCKHGIPSPNADTLDVGVCNRYPPTVHYVREGKLVSGYPEVKAAWTCGEFVHIEEAME